MKHPDAETLTSLVTSLRSSITGFEAGLRYFQRLDFSLIFARIGPKGFKIGFLAGVFDILFEIANQEVPIFMFLLA